MTVIRQAWEEINRLPKTNRLYSIAAIQVASALSSSGDLKHSIDLLHSALEYATSDQEKGLAAYNLFQLYLREQNHQDALEHLQAAIEIDAASQTGVDNIRDLKEGIRFVPSRLKYKATLCNSVSVKPLLIRPMTVEDCLSYLKSSNNCVSLLAS
jgi:tetratricopeptide (TPR) repeat protein